MGPLVPLLFSSNRRAAAFTPASLTNLVVALDVTLARSQGKLWQDAGKTVPAAANGDLVRIAACPYTGLEFSTTDASRPALFDEGGGKWSLQFNGSDDEMQAVQTWPGVTAGSLSGRWKWGGSGDILPIQARVYAGNGDYVRFSGDGNAYCRNFRVNRANAFAAVSTSTAYRTYTQQSGANYRVYLDGSQLGSTVAADWEAPATLRIGAGDGFFGGRIAGVVFAAADWDAATRAQVEAYLGGLA